jgi:hypothetical protein
MVELSCELVRDVLNIKRSLFLRLALWCKGRLLSKTMYDCKQCGINNWKWVCEKGMMEGTCQNCGEKSNRFKAHTKTVKKTEIQEHSS